MATLCLLFASHCAHLAHNLAPRAKSSAAINWCHSAEDREAALIYTSCGPGMFILSIFFFPIFEWRYSQKSYYGLKSRWINTGWNRSSVAITFPLLKEKDKNQTTTGSQLIGDSVISLTLCVINHLLYKQIHSAQDHLNLHFICRKPIKNKNLFWANLVLECLVLWGGVS